MEAIPPIKPPRGIKPGKESSGLLMSVIRTLSASETNEQRDTEKLKIEEEFKKSNRKLDELVSRHDQDLTKVMQIFGTLSTLVYESRENIRRVKENLEACKVLLHCRRDELKKLWFEGLEYKYMLQLLEEIQQMIEVPNKFAGYLMKKHYLHATELLMNAVSLGKDSLEGVEGIKELYIELEQKKQQLFIKLVEELRVHLYVRPCQEVTQLRRQGSAREPNVIQFQRGSEQRLSNRQRQKILEENAVEKTTVTTTEVVEDEDVDPESDSNHFMAIIVKCLVLLGRLPAALNTLRQDLHKELQQIINNTITFVQQQQQQQQQPRTSVALLDLICMLFDEFRAVIQAHTMLRTHIYQQHAISAELHNLTEVWLRIQDGLKQLLIDHLDIHGLANSAAEQQLQIDFNDPNDLNVYFAKKKPQTKKKTLFKLEDTSNANLLTTVNNSKLVGNKALVCTPDSNHLTTIFVPVMRFVDEVEQATGTKPCPLNAFLADYVTEKFLAQRRAELQSAVDAATRAPDAWKTTAVRDNQMKDEEEEIVTIVSNLPLLDSVVTMERQVAGAARLLHDLPLHGEKVLRDTTMALRDFRDAAQSAYQSAVQPAALSVAWLRDDDISRFLQSLPNWLELQSEQQKPMLRRQNTVDEESPEAVRQRNIREADMLASNLGEAGVGSHEVLTEPGALRSLALLHESLEWLARRMYRLAKLIRNEPDVAVSAASLQQLQSVANEFEELANRCLLVLHLEVRVQCFYYLLRADLEGDSAEDVEPRVLELGRALATADEALNGALQPRKCRYVFEGLGHLVANVLIGSAARMMKADSNAVQRQCRNVLALQQSLAAVTMARDPALDRARRYFELLCLNPDDILATILEKGPEFSQLEYTNILQLLARTHGFTSNVHIYINRLYDILHGVTVTGITV